jgi:undecaprenyl-diphosphatase
VLLGSRDKALDVFLHAGTAAAMLAALPFPRFRPLTVAPAAVAGLALERPIEQRLGKRAVAIAQIAGGLALLFADLAPERRSDDDCGARDDLVLGLAQACALVPGVSRNGATITAARLLGFHRDAASRLSRDAALPVIAGATALKLFRLRGTRPSPAHLAGFATALGSGLAAARLVPRIDRVSSYAPFGLYRVVLGLIALRFVRLNGRND